MIADILYIVFLSLICAGISFYAYTYALDIDDSISDLRREFAEQQMTNNQEVSELKEQIEKQKKDIDFLIKNRNNEKT